MKSDREAKKVLKAFGREAYKERIKYVDSFLPEKTSFIRSINYRHTLRRVVMVAILVVLIMALAVSVYAAVLHYLNYTRAEHNTTDEYIPNNDNTAPNQADIFFEPTYVPEGYELASVGYDELFDEREWQYINTSNEILIIRQSHKNNNLYVDNERSTRETIIIDNIEAIIYDSEGDKKCILQYDDTTITIIGSMNSDEVEQIIRGLNLPE